MFRDLRRIKQKLSHEECIELLKNEKGRCFRFWEMMTILTVCPLTSFTVRKTARYIDMEQNKVIR